MIFSRRYIYIERAREIALKDAGIEGVDRVEFTVEELVDGGIKTPYYLFRFNNGSTQWTYRIDATDGGIQFTDKEEFKINRLRNLSADASINVKNGDD